MNRLIHPWVPVVILCISAAYIVFSSMYDWRFAHQLFIEFSTAGVIFGGLGLTLEPSMRKSLARDVFHAAFGYHMPDDFKTEIGRIASQTVICTKHIMNVRIQSLEDARVRVVVTIERHLMNIGVAPRLQDAMTWIDDWGFDEPARIIRCDISNQVGTRRKQFSPQRIERLPDNGIRTRTPRMLLLPQEIVIVHYEYSFVKRNNEQLIEWFLSPARTLEINIIEKPNDMNVTASFGSDLKLKYTNIPDRYELNGVYFPPAVMKVRWWPTGTVSR